MANDARRLLDVLRAELEFIEKGGYRHTARTVWRPHFIFQDSPTCLNFDPIQSPKPCGDCVLMRLIPQNAHARKVPCRYIPLNASGETIGSPTGQPRRKNWRRRSRSGLRRRSGDWSEEVLRGLRRRHLKYM